MAAMSAVRIDWIASNAASVSTSARGWHEKRNLRSECDRALFGWVRLLSHKAIANRICTATLVLQPLNP